MHSSPCITASELTAPWVVRVLTYLSILAVYRIEWTTTPIRECLRRTNFVPVNTPVIFKVDLWLWQCFEMESKSPGGLITVS